MAMPLTATDIARALAMGIDPRSLAIQGAMGPGMQPITVTPASPAPVQPGATMIAPPPTSQTFLNQSALQDGMAAGQPAEVEGLEVTVPRRLSPEQTGVNVVRDAISAAQEQVNAAEAGAKINPALEAILRQREERYAGEETQSAEDRKRAGWMALAMAGARMAQSQSPYFAAALAEGLETGLTGFNKARADAAERKARLMDKREQIEIDRLTANEKARELAVSRLQAIQGLAKGEREFVRSEGEYAREGELHPSKIKKAEAEATEAEVDAAIAREYGPRLAAAQLTEAEVKADIARRFGISGEELDQAVKRSQIAAYGRQGRDRDNEFLPREVRYQAENLREAAARKIRAAETIKDRAQKTALLNEAKKFEDQASRIEAPYFRGFGASNPIASTLGKAVPEGMYYTLPEYPGAVFRQNRAAPGPGKTSARKGATPSPSGSGAVDFGNLPK